MTSSYEAVRAWKDLELRDSASGGNHPAGEIALDSLAVGGNAATAGVECTGPDSCTGWCCTWDIGGWCPPITLERGPILQ